MQWKMRKNSLISVAILSAVTMMLVECAFIGKREEQHGKREEHPFSFKQCLHCNSTGKREEHPGKREENPGKREENLGKREEHPY